LEIGNIASTENIEEAVNNIEIGGRNLLLNSENLISNNEYDLAEYYLTETPTSGETYTISFFAKPAAEIIKILIYNSGGNQHLAEIILSEEDKNKERFY
jgi:hypothetical protein